MFWRMPNLRMPRKFLEVENSGRTVLQICSHQASRLTNSARFWTAPVPAAQPHFHPSSPPVPKVFNCALTLPAALLACVHSMKELLPPPPPVVRNQHQAIVELFQRNVVPSYARFELAFSHGQ